MSQETEHEPQEPQVTDVPEPDQDQDDTGVEDPESPEGADPTDPNVAPVEAVNEEGVEKAFVSLQKEATRHANRISQIMGEDANLLEPCPRCVTSDPQRPATPGFVWPNEVVPLLPEDKARVKLSIGEGVEPDYKTNDDAYECPKCAGWTKYPTGSKDPKQKFILCDGCNGRGWIGQRALSVPKMTDNGASEPVLVTGGDDRLSPDADPWGRLRDDPLYGVMPGFER